MKCSKVWELLDENGYGTQQYGRCKFKKKKINQIDIVEIENTQEYPFGSEYPAEWLIKLTSFTPQNIDIRKKTLQQFLQHENIDKEIFKKKDKLNRALILNMYDFGQRISLDKKVFKKKPDAIQYMQSLNY